MNIFTELKQTHRHREQTCGCQRGGEGGEGWTEDLGLADGYYYTRMDKKQVLTV